MSQMGDLVIKVGMAYQKANPGFSWDETMNIVRGMSLEDALCLAMGKKEDGDVQNVDNSDSL